MERSYHTQMEAARMGIITPEMKAVAKKETGPKRRSADGSRKGKR